MPDIDDLCAFEMHRAQAIVQSADELLRQVRAVIARHGRDCHLQLELAANRYEKLRTQQERSERPVVHWIRSTPITKPAEERGLMCATPYLSNVQASSYREQVTCRFCLQAHK